MEELKSKLETLYQRVDGLKDNINTEEATKNAFIMPFLQIMGYDIFNPTEVIPEFTADIGTKKGEKVDYAIMKDNEPVIIIECKHWKEKAEAHNSQLHRYYNVSKARFGIMTNGIIYNFFTDLEKANIMDEKPFLTIDLSNLKDNSIKELKKFSKQTFNIDDILNSAEALKYIKAIRVEFEQELQNPTDDLIKLLVRKFYEKQITPRRLEMFREYTHRAIALSLKDIIDSRLKSALKINEEEDEDNEDENTEEDNELRIITTDEELEGYQIVKAILREKIPSNRISYRDTQSYFGILLDDTNRKPLCRLYFNSSNKRIELFNEGKNNSQKVVIENLEEIYHYKQELLSTIDIYE